MNTQELLFTLVALHFLCDYPLRGDFIGKFKNRHNHETKLGHPYLKTNDEIAYENLCDHILSYHPRMRCNRFKDEHFIDIGIPWWHLMMAHSFIQGGAVALVTGSILFGLIEIVNHFIIDVLKCENKISIHTDQLLHIICKMGYVIILQRYHGY